MWRPGIFCCALLVVGCAGVNRAVPDPEADLGAADLASPDDGGADLYGTSGDDLLRADLAHAPPDLAGSDGPGCNISSVVVNEVQVGGATANDEWVELYNPCANSVSLSGAKVTYRSATNTASADTNTLADLTQTIGAHGYLLIVNAGYTGSATPDVTPFKSGGLAAAGGAVGLRDSANNLVDSVGWGTANNQFVEAAAVMSPPAGSSAARKPNGTDTNHNNTDFTVVSTPTPRAPN